MDETITGDPLHARAADQLLLTQRELAELIGTTLESISRWEREARPIAPWVFLAVISVVSAKLMPLITGFSLTRANSSARP